MLTNNQKAELKSFVNDMRSLVIFADLLRQSAEAQLANDNTTGWMYKDIHDIKKAIDRLVYHMEVESPKSAFFIREELEGERVANLHWLMAEAVNVGNLEEVINIIRECKTPAP